MPTLQVFIRQYKFNVSCTREDEAAMRAAARLVEEKVGALREKVKVADGERAAMMAALQVAFEAQNAPSVTGNTKIAAMRRRIESTLERTNDYLQERAANGVNQ